jgi:hypothetical protein
MGRSRVSSRTCNNNVIVTNTRHRITTVGKEGPLIVAAPSMRAGHSKELSKHEQINILSKPAIAQVQRHR